MPAPPLGLVTLKSAGRARPPHASGGFSPQGPAAPRLQQGGTQAGAEAPRGLREDFRIPKKTLDS